MRIAFNASERASLGVEVELALVDTESGELTSVGSGLLAELGAPHPGSMHPKAKHELFECTVEIITGVCQSVAEARADLSETLHEVQQACAARGVAPICAGSHPFSHWRDQEISPNPRYASLIDRVQWTGLRLQIFGVHFHVGVKSAEKSIRIANALCAWLPHLLALSASSPYWQGHDTGMASCRTKVFEALPTAGLPYRLSDWAEFEAFIGTLVNAEAIAGIREVWWDIRPHPDFGTVELRMCDGLPTLHEVAAIAAIAQSLVASLDRAIDEEAPLPEPREWVIRQNKWLAARHGLEAELIIDDDGNRSPARVEIERMLADLVPTAHELGCGDELASVAGIMACGPSYVRQRRIVEQGGTLHDVVDALVAEMATDEPGARP